MDALGPLEVIHSNEIDQLVELLLIVFLFETLSALGDRAAEIGRLRYRPPGIIRTLIALLQGSTFTKLFLKGLPNYCFAIKDRITARQ